MCARTIKYNVQHFDKPCCLEVWLRNRGLRRLIRLYAHCTRPTTFLVLVQCGTYLRCSVRWRGFLSAWLCWAAVVCAVPAGESGREGKGKGGRAKKDALCGGLFLPLPCVAKSRTRTAPPTAANPAARAAAFRLQPNNAGGGRGCVLHASACARLACLPGWSPARLPARLPPCLLWFCQQQQQQQQREQHRGFERTDSRRTHHTRRAQTHAAAAHGDGPLRLTAVAPSLRGRMSCAHVDRVLLSLAASMHPSSR
jgi:hypothetical protein